MSQHQRQLVLVIVTDDASVWAHRQHCYLLSERLTTAKQRFESARGASTIDFYLAGGCAENAEVVACYRANHAGSELFT